jgi:AcrR family transcriptional regulator
MAYYRAGYHHGDARAALLRAAFNLARGGGPPTVTLRAAAREVGITATAVYRHFTTVEELLTAVKCRSLRVLAQRLDGAVSGSGSGFGLGPDSASALGCRIRAVAEAYVSFARENPGLFAMACHGGVEDALALVAERIGDVPRPTGLAVWSAVHGVAALPGSEAEQERVLDIVLAGIVSA